MEHFGRFAGKRLRSASGDSRRDGITTGVLPYSLVSLIDEQNLSGADREASGEDR
jgi:hypothetical protein